jgi:hypothetical protein
VDEFVKSDCEWLLMVDNDMVVALSILEMTDTAPRDADVLVPRQFALCKGGTEASPKITLRLAWSVRVGNPPV